MWLRLAALVLLILIASIGCGPTTPAESGDWPMWGGGPERTMWNSKKHGIPLLWNCKPTAIAPLVGGNAMMPAGMNVKWAFEVTTDSFGSPSVGDGYVLVGTNNRARHDPSLSGDRGVVVCLSESDGEFLWQAVHDRLAEGRRKSVHDMPYEVIASTPVISEGHCYYVNNRAEVVCADLKGFRDGENNGPYRSEVYDGDTAADFIWIVDLKEMGVRPHFRANSSCLVSDDVLLVCTGNGVGSDQRTVAYPDAPSFIAMNRRDGSVLWSSNAPAGNVLQSQWSSPTVAVVEGRKQAVFGGGDGWLYGFSLLSGDLLWRFNCNLPSTLFEPVHGGNRNSIVATPIVEREQLFVGTGHDPVLGFGEGRFLCLDLRGASGEVAESAIRWEKGGGFQRSVSTACVSGSLVFAADIFGNVFCWDRDSGEEHWRFDAGSSVVASPTVIDGRLYVATHGGNDGQVLVFHAGSRLKVLARLEVGRPILLTPIAANGVLYVASEQKLYAVSSQGD